MTSAQALQWVVALGVGAVIQTLARYLGQRKKMGADAAKAITEAATVLIAPLSKRVAELEPLRKRVEELEDQIEALQEALDEAIARAEHAEQVARIVADTAHMGQQGIPSLTQTREARGPDKDV